MAGAGGSEELEVGFKFPRAGDLSPSPGRIEITEMLESLVVLSSRNITHIEPAALHSRLIGWNMMEPLEAFHPLSRCAR